MDEIERSIVGVIERVATARSFYKSGSWLEAAELLWIAQNSLRHLLPEIDAQATGAHPVYAPMPLHQTAGGAAAE